MSLLRWLSVLLWLIIVTVSIVTLIGGMFLPVELPGDRPGPLSVIWLMIVMLAFATVGALIAWHNRANVIGWLFLAIPLGLTIAVYAEMYVLLGTYGVPLPGVQFVAWTGSWTWLVSLVVAFGYLLQLFPTGRPLTHRWRWVVWATSALLLAAVAGEAGAPGVVGGYDDVAAIANPFGVPEQWASTWNAWRTAVPFALTFASVASAASLVIRFRRSAGVERQQLKWFVYPGWLSVLGFLLVPLGAAGLVSGDLAWHAVLLGFAGMSLGAAVAILRYRLYDIDLVIRRTLVYGALTVTLGTLYAVSVVVLQGLLSGFVGGGGVAVAASTLGVAALFQPMRRWVQRWVDRRFYRSRYDAARMLEAFSARLRHEVDLARLTDELRGAVVDALQPASASVWLREGIEDR